MKSVSNLRGTTQIGLNSIPHKFKKSKVENGFQLSVMSFYSLVGRS